MQHNKICEVRNGRCPRCGKIFDVTPYLKASAEVSYSGVRPQGELRNPMEDAVKAKLSVKCPYCLCEYSEEQTII